MVGKRKIIKRHPKPGLRFPRFSFEEPPTLAEKLGNERLRHRDPFHTFQTPSIGIREKVVGKMLTALSPKNTLEERLGKYFHWRKDGKARLSEILETEANFLFFNNNFSKLSDARSKAFQKLIDYFPELYKKRR